MHIPRYWRRATGIATRPDGTSLRVIGWGWSAVDGEDAEREARTRLGRVIERVARGEALPDRYPYGVRALREEIVDEIPGPGDAAAVVTRNSYGSLVINAASVMFIDVDRPGAGAWARLKSLFTRAREDDLGALTSAVAAASTSACRVYRTAGGFRVIATGRAYEPGSSEAERIMTAVGADPAYVQLCRAQRSFRARVSPKPWRCGHRPPPNGYPRDPVEQIAFQAWLHAYEAKCAAAAVCEYVADVGTGRVIPEVAPILRYHDDRTRAGQALPLA